METIGYVLSDLLELHSTATKKKKTTWQKIVFLSSALLLVAFVSYETYALWRSYHRPIWIPSIEHHESLSYPEVLLCPPQGSVIEKQSVQCNSYSDGKRDGPCSRAVFNVEKGQFKMQSCLNINYLMEEYTPIETTTDEMTLMLVKYKTMKAIEAPNMKNINDQDDFDTSFEGNETTISDQHNRSKRGDSSSLEPFGNPTYVMIFDQGVKNDPDFSFEPSFILSNGHYYVSIERNEDRYRDGKVSFSFESSVSSSTTGSKSDVGFTTVAFTITNFDVVVSEETVEYDWLEYLGNIGGAIAFMNVLYVVVSAVGSKLFSLLCCKKKKKIPKDDESEKSINLLDDFGSFEFKE